MNCHKAQNIQISLQQESPMISLDEEIKKDKQKQKNEKKEGRRESRDRSRDRYMNKDDSWRKNRNDYYRNEHSNKNRYPKDIKPQKTIVKFTHLHYSVTKQQLKSLCEKYGALKFCKIHWDKMGRSKETAVAGYFNEKDAQKAATQMKNMKFEDMQVVTELCSSDRNEQRSPQQESWSRRNDRGRRSNYNN